MTEQGLEDELSPFEIEQNDQVTALKESVPEVEPIDDLPDPGDPPGVVEVDTEWTPDLDEE